MSWIFTSTLLYLCILSSECLRNADGEIYVSSATASVVKCMTPYVFPKKNNIMNGNVVWKSMYIDLFLDVMGWLTEYHIRSHSESFHSSFKTKYGMITKRRVTSKLTQITARIILHNRRNLSYWNRLQK